MTIMAFSLLLGAGAIGFYIIVAWQGLTFAWHASRTLWLGFLAREQARAGGVMGAIEIVPVASPAELNRFIALPARLYANDPHYVAPLALERREALSPAKNPVFRARRGAVLAGGARMVATSGASARRSTGLVTDPEVGHFGMIAAVDDPAVFAALFETAEAWLRSRGKRRLLGPFNLSINEETGLLVDGFDSPPVMLMGHDPSYAGGRIEALGYSKTKDLIAYLYDIEHELPAAARRRIDTRKPAALTVRKLDMKRYIEEFDTVTAIFNDAWSENWGFIAFTPAEIAHMAKSLKMLIDPNCVAIVEMNGEAVGFGIALPNLNELIADFNGRLLPFNWLKLLLRPAAWRANRARAADGHPAQRGRHAGGQHGAVPGDRRVAQRLAQQGREAGRTVLDPRGQPADAPRHRGAGRQALQDLPRLREEPRVVTKGADSPASPQAAGWPWVRLTALVLAGTRAGGDPLAEYAGVSHKALIEVGGRTMIERVVGALAALPQVARIVVAIEQPALLQGLPGLQPPACSKPLVTMPTSARPQRHRGRRAGAVGRAAAGHDRRPCLAADQLAGGVPRALPGRCRRDGGAGAARCGRGGRPRHTAQPGCALRMVTSQVATCS